MENELRREISISSFMDGGNIQHQAFHSLVRFPSCVVNFKIHISIHALFFTFVFGKEETYCLLNSVLSFGTVLVSCSDSLSYIVTALCGKIITIINQSAR